MNVSMLDHLEAGVAKVLDMIEHLQLEREQLAQHVKTLEQELAERRSAFDTLAIEHDQLKQVYQENAEWITRKDEVKQRVEQLLMKLDAA
ncbi:MAG: cell division protein ZapB [Candidatus Latescibacteria bacterium]|nr:cell division protein ZapB [Candidatus Latescibacterota bacterium]